MTLSGFGGARAVVVGLCLLLVLDGCGYGRVLGSGVSEQRLRIGFVVPATTFHFAREMGEGFEAGARLAGGVQATVAGPRTYDGVRQRAAFEEMTTRVRGGIAVAVTPPAMFSQPLAEAAAEGVPVVACGGAPPPGSGVRLLVENDNYELGRMLAAEAIRRVPPGVVGTVILGSNMPSHPSLAQRARGIRDVIAGALSGVRVLGPFDTQRDVGANRAAWATLAAAHPQAVALLGLGDVDAVTLAGMRPVAAGVGLAGGFSIEPPVLQAVRDGRLFGVVSPEHFVKGAGIGWLLAERARGGRALPEGWLVAPGLLVTAGNVDEIIDRQSTPAGKLAWFTPQIHRITTDPTPLLRPLEQAR